MSDVQGNQSNLHRVFRAMLHVAGLRGLAGSPADHLRQGKLAVTEGIAHELAHQLDAGRGFERRLHLAGDEEANEREASALRVEVAGLAALGVRVSLRLLWREANWRAERPVLSCARRALTSRERKCVAAFARIARSSMRRLSGVEPTLAGIVAISTSSGAKT